MSFTGGNVGIGTTSPIRPLDITIPYAKTDTAERGVAFLGRTNEASNFSALNLMMWGGAAQGSRKVGLQTIESGVSSSGSLLLQPEGGNVGIGTTSPTAKLHVIGDIRASGNIAALYQDVAEWVDAATPLDDGTVVIVDPERLDHVAPSARAYDTLVAGAVSRQPGVVLGEAGPGKELVAQSGRVRVKVDASYGAIAIGDLLVTSPTLGHAMKSTPVDLGGVQLHRPGTLLGKALEPMASGKGEILVLLTLQ